MITEQTFGTPCEDVTYTTQAGAYLVAIENGSVHVLRQADGKLRLPGGSLSEGEAHEARICRACMEDTGYDVAVEDFVTVADQFDILSTGDALHAIQYFYSGCFTELISPPTAGQKLKHLLLPLSEADRLSSPLHRYGVEQCLEMLRADAHGSDDEDL